MYKLVLQVGDMLKVLPGAAFPADGTLLAGSSSADESLITGEALPVTKQPGAAVIGGSVNGSGLVVMRVGRVGPDTVLSSIVRLVQEAQANKAAMQVKDCAWYDMPDCAVHDALQLLLRCACMSG
jgi:Cu+-exporting ATPase